MAEKTAKRILLAEDETPMARALELKLEHQGYQVDAVGNGEEAIEMLQSGTKYHLFLCDLMMPKVDGFEVLEFMNKEGIKIKTVILSNLSQEEDKAKVKEMGVVDFYVKSNTPIAEIVSMVTNLIK
mgnify:CR=1 FL=1